MLECKDCCLYNTDACRYGRYALEHNMSINCDDFIVEHNKAYQQGRADAEKELQGIKDLGKLYSEIRAEAIDELTKALCEYNLGIKMYTLEELNGIWADIREIAEKVKEQKDEQM